MVTAIIFILKMYGGPGEPVKLSVSIFNLKNIKMKRIKTLGLTVIMVIIFFGCEEVKDPAGQRNIGVVPLISDVTGIFISGESGSYIQFTVDLANGSTVDNAEIEVSRQDNFERVKISDLNAFPSTYTFTLGQIAEKLGVIDAGDLIYIEIVTTKDGISTRSNAALALIVFCEYSPELAVGSYHSVSPPNEWNSEGDIAIKADPGDPYTVYVTGLEAIEGLDEDQGPLVMHIDPVTFAVTADKTVLASDAWGDTDIAYEGSGTYNSCSGTYSMRFDISTDQSDYGVYAFTFTRN
jgi:hypothetical protein